MTKKSKKRKIYFVLGNGFSIDAIFKMERSQDIDLINLFSKADLVPWPDKNAGCFLSQKHCSELWTLGARSTMSKEGSSLLIDDIITSMNVYFLSASDEERGQAMKDSFYYNAYCQLVSYLKNLFIYYNNMISKNDLTRYLSCNKGNLINYIKNCLDQDCLIRIITYNYDVLLERLLIESNIDFKTAGFEPTDDDEPLIIMKPHGSISFVTKNKRPCSQLYNAIRDPFDNNRVNIDDLYVSIDVSQDESIINAIIPPAGDANRIAKGWSKEIDRRVNQCIKEATELDKFIILGISYNHVDRNELDRIITALPFNIDVSYINPFPSSTLDMVLGSIFNNYSHYKSLSLEV